MASFLLGKVFDSLGWG